MRRPPIYAATALVAVALSGCNGTSTPPQVGQTSYAPGNEDPCVWDGSRWAEVDDGEDCDVELDAGHRTTHRTASTKTTARKASDPSRRTSTRKTR